MTENIIFTVVIIIKYLLIITHDCLIIATNCLIIILSFFGFHSKLHVFFSCVFFFFKEQEPLLSTSSYNFYRGQSQTINIWTVPRNQSKKDEKSENTNKPTSNSIYNLLEGSYRRNNVSSLQIVILQLKLHNFCG